MKLADIIHKAHEWRGVKESKITFVAADVEDHEELAEVDKHMETAIGFSDRKRPIVITSQVPPGWTRKWAEKSKRTNIFYQPHTIIGGSLKDAVFPSFILVGMADIERDVPQVYQAYLEAFQCRVYKTTYETAELSKLALNYLLASQINAVAKLALVAEKVGADWLGIAQMLRLDQRIGPHAYLRPGEAGGHLPRDVKTVESILGRTSED